MELTAIKIFLHAVIVLLTCLFGRWIGHRKKLSEIVALIIISLSIMFLTKPYEPGVIPAAAIAFILLKVGYIVNSGVNNLIDGYRRER